MASLSAAVLVVLLTAISALGQIDTSFFKDLPPDPELIRLGQPTREEMRRSMRVMHRLGAELDSGLHAIMVERTDTAHLSPVDDDDAAAWTLEDKIQNPSNVRFLYIDLKKHPMERLPEGFDNLTDLEFLVITGLPEGAHFDFDGAFRMLSRISGLTDLYIINNGKGFHTIPPAIGHMAALERLTCYRNAITTLPPELSTLVHLTSLSIEHNNLTGLPASFHEMHHLKTLGLEENAISAADCAALQHSLPDCVITYSGGR